MSDHERPGIGRRDFLRAGLAAGGTTVLGSRLPALGPEQPRAEGDALTQEAVRGAESRELPAFELEELQIAELQDGMRSGRFTARDLARQYLERIREIDAAGPRLGSVIETNPDAL